MSKPNVAIGSSLGFKEESQAGTKISLSSGASFIDLIACNLKYTAEKYSEPAIMGTRIQGKQSEVLSHNNGNGTFSCRARAAYLEPVVKMALGRTVSSGIYAPILNNAELPTFTIENSLASANTIRLIGAKCDELVLKSEAGQPLILDASVLSMSGARNPQDLTVANYANWLAQGLFMHSNMTLAATNAAWLGGNTGKEVKSIEVTLKNNLSDDDFTNSVDREFISEGMFEALLKMTVPYNSTTKGYWAAVAALDIVVITIEWSDGENVLTLEYKGRCDTDLPEISDVSPKFVDLEFHTVSESNSDNAVTLTVG
jgi:hypothetical protein